MHKRRPDSRIAKQFDSRKGFLEGRPRIPLWRSTLFPTECKACSLQALLEERKCSVINEKTERKTGPATPVMKALTPCTNDIEDLHEVAAL